MWRWAVVLGLAQVAAMGQQKVPFVGCPADGQAGPVEAPKPVPITLNVSKSVASQIAYYATAGGLSVIGPRGWHCFEVYGSSGAYLFVTPEPSDADRWWKERKKFTGPTIEIAAHNSGASGRFQVAEVIARVFPARRAWAEEIGVGFESFELPKGPHPADILKTIDRNTVEFTTPPNEQGLGTDGWIEPSSLPIRGAAYLNSAPDAFVLSVRLPKKFDGLVPGIIQQFRKDAAKLE